MENQKKMQFYGGTFGACLPLLVFMALMITIAALQKVSLVLFCMAGFAVCAQPSCWPRTRRNLRRQWSRA